MLRIRDLEPGDVVYGGLVVLDVVLPEDDEFCQILCETEEGTPWMIVDRLTTDTISVERKETR